jgi:hypothetical protein
MGFGLLILASIGSENVYFNTNPLITFFKKVYKKNSNISNENLPQYFRSSPNFGRRLSTRIAKNSDMIKDITVYFELPDIQPSNITSSNSLPNGIKKFAWANKIGFAMIKYIDLEIGGVLISRNYGDWLNIQYETKWNDDEGWDKNIGNNISLLTDYSNGKSSYKLYIPLSFFFNEIGFPLISISKQDIEIHVELNDFSQCYKQTPTNYFEIDSYVCLYKKDEVIIQNVDGTKSGGNFVYFDVYTKRVYYNKLYNDFLIPPNSNNTKYNIIGQTSGFYIQPKIGSIIIKDEDYFPSAYPVLKNAFILVNYIYLDSEERLYFLNKEIQYIVPLVSNVLEKDITGINSNYNLKLVNPHKVIYWRAQLNSNLNINDVFNYSSLPLTTNDEPLIQSSKILINSIARNEIYNNEYYERVQPYINKTFSNRNISMFSFGFNPLDYNPQGTMNFSMVDDAIIQMNLNKLVNYTNSINVRAYGLYYNVLIIKNGNSSMKFYL